MKNMVKILIVIAHAIALPLMGAEASSLWKLRSEQPLDISIPITLAPHDRAEVNEEKKRVDDSPDVCKEEDNICSLCMQPCTSARPNVMLPCESTVAGTGLDDGKQQTISALHPVCSDCYVSSMANRSFERALTGYKVACPTCARIYTEQDFKYVADRVSWFKIHEATVNVRAEQRQRGQIADDAGVAQGLMAADPNLNELPGEDPLRCSNIGWRWCIKPVVRGAVVGTIIGALATSGSSGDQGPAVGLYAFGTGLLDWMVSNSGRTAYAMYRECRDRVCQ